MFAEPASKLPTPCCCLITCDFGPGVNGAFIWTSFWFFNRSPVGLDGRSCCLDGGGVSAAAAADEVSVSRVKRL